MCADACTPNNPCLGLFPAGVSEQELLRHLVLCFDFYFTQLDTRLWPEGKLEARAGAGAGPTSPSLTPKTSLCCLTCRPLQQGRA